jgi:AraC family transcriptional regulator
MSIYLDKINLAMKLIKRDLSSPIKWDEISKECGISHFHFHRIFSSHVNETPGQYITRKRLEKGVLLIAYGTNVSLVDVALSCGYSSQANFTKAFKKYFGVTPGQVIKGEQLQNSSIGKIKSRYGKEFKIESLYPREEVNQDLYLKEVKMNFEIKELEKRKVAFISSQEGYLRESIYNTWQKLIGIMAATGKNPDDLAKYGVGHDNPEVTAEEKCRYDACVEVTEKENIPAGVNTNHFPAGKYACFHYKGSGEKLLQFYLDIYKNWFTQAGHEPGDFPLIERYIFVDKDDPNADIELETQFLLK